MKPSDVPVLDGIFMPDAFGKCEAELVAALMLAQLVADGDRWRPVTLGELWPRIEAVSAVRAGIVNPVIGRARLEEDGYIVVDRNAAQDTDQTIAFSERGLEQLRRYARLDQRQGGG